MFERLALLFVLAVATPFPASAQSPREILAAEVDSLVAEHARRAAHRAALDSAARARIATLERDTMMVGPIRFIDAPVIVRRNGPALLEAWQRWAPHVGSDHGLFERAVITATMPAAQFDTTRLIRNLSLFEHGPGARERNAMHALGSVVAGVLPEDIAEWLHGAPLLPGDYEWTYRALATATARSARRCHAGDTAECIAALGLNDSGPDLSGWFDRAELRAIVAQRGSRTVPAARCVHHRDDDACIEYLTTSGSTPLPLQHSARASLMMHALEIGGTDAWSRALAADGGPGARISAAAGRPLPEVVASWHSTLTSARPRVYASIARAAGWTVFWLLLFALLARRSTRWRLG